MQPSEPITRQLRVPTINDLTLGEVINFIEMTGFDPRDPDAMQADPVKALKGFAALVVAQAERDGNPTSYEEVLATLKVSEIVKVMGVDAEGNPTSLGGGMTGPG